MNHQFFFGRVFKTISITLLSSAFSFAAVIYDSGITALRSTDPIQLGRLSRSGVPSDWSAPKAFPGTLNPTTSYRYQVFSIPSSPFPYLQITFDDVSGTAFDFVSAYLNAYSPNSTTATRGLDVNYLGDEGSSGNSFGNPTAFQVVIPSPIVSNLLIVVNDATGITSGVGANFRFLVEGFYDTQFNDTTPPVPEPATMALSSAGFVFAAIAAYRRKQKH